jgi:hypothetical protein
LWADASAPLFRVRPAAASDVVADRTTPGVVYWRQTLDGLVARLKSATTWGRFVSDAKHWPSRRAATREQAQRAAMDVPPCPHGLKPANQCRACAQEARQAEERAAEAARSTQPPAAEEIAALVERKRNRERKEKVNERWLAFWESLPANLRQKVNLMTRERMKFGNSFLGESIDEQEMLLDSLENRTHPVFQPTPLLRDLVVEER